MRYYLQPAYLSPPPALEITEEDFFELKRSKLILNAAFAIEENFELLLSNYLELEICALSLVANSMVRHLNDYDQMFEVGSAVNRRVVNLLTSARLFIDQLKQRARACEWDPAEVERLLSAEYDSRFDFRFMEALRNYVQHRGLAVHHLSVASRWLPKGRQEWDEHYLEVSAARNALGEDGKFKATVLAECPERVDLLSTARGYVESLGSVQSSTRKANSERISLARAAVAGAINKYRASTSETITGLEGRAMDGDQVHDRVPVFLDWDNVREKLALRNGSLTNLRLRTIVSAPRLKS